ncbi:MAG: Ferredoxin-1 [Candidatus Anoxychlamydiales bacterium]|nr:Ferredoxin-1 [Candidatus Anoxychlamydiales bacterium]
MAKLIFENTSNEVELKDNEKIQAACEKEGIPFACSEGVCGSCIIEVTEGMENLSEPTQAEKDFLGDIQDERLACQCSIKSGNVKIKF